MIGGRHPVQLAQRTDHLFPVGTPEGHPFAVQAGQLDLALRVRIPGAQAQRTVKEADRLFHAVLFDVSKARLVVAVEQHPLDVVATVFRVDGPQPIGKVHDPAPLAGLVSRDQILVVRGVQILANGGRSRRSIPEGLACLVESSSRRRIVRAQLQAQLELCDGEVIVLLRQVRQALVQVFLGRLLDDL